AQYDGCLFLHQGWPLCLGEQLVLQFSALDWRALQPEDFYLQLAPLAGGGRRRGARLLLKYREEEDGEDDEEQGGGGGIMRELTVPEISYPHLFTVEWLDGINRLLAGPSAAARGGLGAGGRQPRARTLASCLLASAGGRLRRMRWRQLVFPRLLASAGGRLSGDGAAAEPEEEEEEGGSKRGVGNGRDADGLESTYLQEEEEEGGEDPVLDDEGEYVELLEISAGTSTPSTASACSSGPARLRARTLPAANRHHRRRRGRGAQARHRACWLHHQRRRRRRWCAGAPERSGGCIVSEAADCMFCRLEYDDSGHHVGPVASLRQPPTQPPGRSTANRQLGPGRSRGAGGPLEGPARDGCTCRQEQPTVTQPPLAEQKRSLMETEPPLAEQKRSLMETEPPLAEQKRSLMETEPPLAEQKRSVIGTQLPLAEQNGSIFGTQLPLDEQNRSIIGTRQPLAEQNRSISPTEPSMTEQNGFIIGTQLPLAEQNRSVIDTQLPLAEQNRSISLTELLLAEQNGSIIATELSRAGQNGSIIGTQPSLAEQNRSISLTELSLAEQNRSIIGTSPSLAEQNRTISLTQLPLAEQNRTITQTKLPLAEKNEFIIGTQPSLAGPRASIIRTAHPLAEQEKSTGIELSLVEQNRSIIEMECPLAEGEKSTGAEQPLAEQNRSTNGTEVPLPLAGQEESTRTVRSLAEQSRSMNGTDLPLAEGLRPPTELEASMAGEGRAAKPITAGAAAQLLPAEPGSFNVGTEEEPAERGGIEPSLGGRAGSPSQSEAPLAEPQFDTSADSTICVKLAQHRTALPAGVQTALEPAPRRTATPEEGDTGGLTLGSYGQQYAGSSQATGESPAMALDPCPTLGYPEYSGWRARSPDVPGLAMDSAAAERAGCNKHGEEGEVGGGCHGAIWQLGNMRDLTQEGSSEACTAHISPEVQEDPEDSKGLPPSGTPLLQPAKASSPQPADPPSAQPTDPPSPQPVDPQSPQPADPPSPQPTDPPSPQPTDPPSPQPSDPPSPQPTDPPSPQPANHPSPQPSDPPSPQPTDPRLPQPVNPPSPQPADPPSPQPAVPPSPQPANPPSPEPADPPSPQPADPPSAQPVDPPSPQPADPLSPQPAVPLSPQPADSPSPQPANPTSPQTINPPSPQPADSPSPQPANPTSPQTINPPSPQPADSPSPQPANPTSPQTINPPSPQPANPTSPQTINPPSLQPADPPSPQPANPTSPQTINPPSPQPANPTSPQTINPPSLQPAGSLCHRLSDHSSPCVAASGHREPRAKGQQEPGAQDQAIGCYPGNLLKLDLNILHSGVLALPGNRDRNGRALVVVTTKNTIWEDPKCSSTELAKILIYYYNISKAEVQNLGLRLLIDARDCRPTAALYRAFRVFQVRSVARKLGSMSAWPGRSASRGVGFNVPFQGTTYRVFCSVDSVRCHACKEAGHIKKNCPVSKAADPQTKAAAAGTAAPSPPTKYHLAPTKWARGGHPAAAAILAAGGSEGAEPPRGQKTPGKKGTRKRGNGTPTSTTPSHPGSRLGDKNLPPAPLPTPSTGPVVASAPSAGPGVAGGSESKGDSPEEVTCSVVGTGTVLESAWSEVGNSLVPPTESPLIPSGELRAFLKDHSGRPDSVRLALDRWSDLALLVWSAQACSQAASGLAEKERRRVQEFLEWLMREWTGTSFTSASPHD
ncbi:uncharacterized protein LOC144490911, partial [Mustelus asterias]